MRCTEDGQNRRTLRRRLKLNSFFLGCFPLYDSTLRFSRQRPTLAPNSSPNPAGVSYGWGRTHRAEATQQREAERKKKRLSPRPIKLKAPRLSRGCVRKEDGRTLKEREKRDKNEDSVNYTTEEDAPGFSPHLFLTSSQ